MHFGGSASTRLSSSVAQKTSQPKTKGRPLASRGVALLLGVSLAALTSGTAFATQDTWSGGTSVNWADAANWNNGAPVNHDDIIFAQTGSFAPSNLNIANLTVASLTLEATTNATTLANGYAVSGDTLGFVSNGVLLDQSGNHAADQINTGIALNGPLVITVQSGTAGLVIGGTGISGTGGVTVNNESSAGALVFLGSSTYSGGTTVAEGTLQLGNGASNGTITGATTVDSNTTLAFDEATSVTYSGLISGAGSVNQLGTGTVILNNAETYTGGTTVSAGTLQLGDGATNGTIAGDASVATGATLAFNEGSDVTYAGVISGGGGVTQNGSHIVLFTGANTYTGNTTINAGTLQLGNGTTNGTITSNVVTAGGTSLAFNEGTTVTYADAISGGGSVEQSGPGTVIFTGANTYTGGTVIDTGRTLQIGSDSLPGSIAAGGIVIDDGTLDFHNTTAFFQYGSVISGTGAVALDQGTLTFSNVNTYSGGTAVGAGATLDIGTGSAVGGLNSAGAITVGTGGVLNFVNIGSSAEIDGGITGTGQLQVELGAPTNALILTGTNSLTGVSAPNNDGISIVSGTLQIGTLATPGTLSGNVGNLGALDFANTGATPFTFAGSIQGTGSLEIGSSSYVILTNANNFVGTTMLATGTTIDTGGTLQIGDGATSSGSLFGNIVDNGTLVTAPMSGVANQLTLGGNISGTGGLTQSGPGTTILSGTDSYNGTTTVQGGTLEFSGGSFTGTGGFSVSSGATLEFANSTITTLSNLITGAGTLSDTGGVPLILTGDSTGFTGATTIGVGSTLQIGSGATAGSIENTSSVAIASTGTLSFVNPSSSTFGAPISGAGSVTVDLASGSIAFTGTNTYAGGTNLEGGTLQVASSSNLGTGTVNFTGGTLQTTGTGSYALGTTIGTGGGTIDTDGNVVTWSGTIADASGGTPGSLTVTDSTAPNSGTLILTGNNTYTGGTIITPNGTLQIGNETGTGSIRGPVTDNGFLNFDYGGNTTFAGVISGSGQVSQDDTTGSTLTLTGTNTFTGPLNIISGKVAVSADANLGGGGASNYVFMDPGTTLQTTATGTFAHELLIVGDPTIQVNSGTTATWTGQIVDGGTPVGQLDVAGGGTLILTNTSNSYSGGTVVLGNSTLSIDSDSELGASTGGLTLGGAAPNSSGTLDVSQSFTLGASRAVSLAGTGGTVKTESGVTFEIGTGISGSGALTVSGPGTFVLAGASTYTGNTNIAAGGTLQLGDGTTAGTITSAAVSDNGALAFNEAGNLEFTAPITGSGSVTQDDTTGGRLTLTGAEAYTGGTTITSGTLQLGDGTTAGTVIGNITDNAALAFDEPTNTTYTGVVSGTGSVAVNGTSTLTLTANNTYSGTTTIGTGAALQVGNGGATGSIGNSSAIVDNGTLTIDTNGQTLLIGGITGSGNLSQIGSGTTILAGANSYLGTTTVSSGTLQIGNGGTTGSLMGNITDNAAVVFNRTDTSTYGGAITGSGTVTQAGTGTTILTGNSSYTGTTTITAGLLQIGNGGTSGSLTSNVTNNANLTFDRSDTSTYGGVITGNGTVTQSGAGTTILTGNSTYTGATTISSGTLQIGNGGTSGSLTSNITNNAALSFNRSDSSTYAGNITGTGSVTQAGAGTTALTGTSTYSGGTLISAGTLQLGNASAAGSITGNVTDNGTLAFDRSNSYVFNGVISGNGGVTQAGGGQTTLTAAETYTGPTAVNGGTLLVNGSITASSGTTVGSGGTIGGTGTVGKLTVGNNGTVTTGSGGIGTLTVNGNFIMGGGATYAAQVSPTQSDLLNVNGTAALNGALTVTPTGTGFSATPITILQASGGISGQFSSFTVFGNPNEIPILSYTADDVDLTFAPSVSSLLPATSADTNQGRVGDAIDFALAHDNAIALQAVTGETGTALTQTLSELSGETAVGFQNVAASSVASFMSTLFDPSIGGRGGLGAGTDGITDSKQLEQLAYNGPNSDVPYQHPSLRAVTVWTSAYGYQDTTDANTSLGTHRTTSSQYGGTVGLDYRPKKGDGSLGIAVGMSGNTWDLSNQLGKGEATAYQIGAYYSRRFWDTYFTGGLSYARYSASTDRTVNLGGENLYHADFVSNAIAARAEAGHVFHTDIGRITPFVRFQADDIGVPHYAEQTQAGSPAYALSYTGKQHYDYTTELGTGWSTLLGQWTDLHARVGWLHDYAGGLSDIATFSEFSGASFQVDGASPPRDAAHIVLGIAHNVNNVVFSLNGETALAGTSTTYGGSASIAYRW
jgi:fibronectin-binding autotransporter adhesin